MKRIPGFGVASLFLLGAIGIAAALAVASADDLKRYMHIRSM